MNRIARTSVRLIPWICLSLSLMATGCRKSPAQSAPESSPWVEASAYSGGAGISGVITVDNRLADKLSKTDTLYIIAYNADRPKGSGPPLAAKRIASPRFPLVYTIGPEDLIAEGSIFSGRINISARIDKDGDAGPIQPGDLEGRYKKNPTSTGEKGVDIMIDRIY